jgi:Pro-kumamolisin, activation domain/Divergent InlB B-repeat domain
MIMQRFQRFNSANHRKWQTLRRLGFVGGALAAVAFGFASWPADMVQTALAQTAVGRAQPLITQPVNDGSLFGLSGNTRREAKNSANDRGRVNDAMPMPRLMLQLRRPAAQEQALAKLIDQLHDPNAPSYHHWLTANEIGAQFGPAASDIATVTDWLTQHGFTVNAVYPNGMAIEFSGTAGQVRSAFHTEIHNLSVNGAAHFANVTDPQIPAALAPLVVGVTSLNDFRPRPQVVHKPQATGDFSQFDILFYVTPPDLATIYNFNQAFNGGITGKGQTIYLVEDSDIYTNGGAVNDWATFRTGFGIPVANYPGASLATIHPNCTDPGLNGNDAEAIIDAEYASAAAPSAAIVMAVCDDFVGMLQTMFNNPSTYPPAIMSISYGECEAVNGAAVNAAYRNAYQTGVAEGWSIFVSAGDQGAGGCNFGGATVTDGVAVNGLGSTVYNVAVGGTDFGDTFAGQNNTYWNSANSATFGSALSYIPEIPWNTTCGSQLFATYEGFATTYGASGFCNSSFVANTADGFYLENWAGSGGQSLCAQGTPSVSGVISGTCTGWPKPSWQNGFLGNPADTVRDLPDVSMFASFGPWFHAYAICYSDTVNGGTPCDGTANGWSTGWGGTSFGSPIWAGIQALVNQYTGSTQGNPNPVLYQLAAAEYGASGSSACNSSNGNAVSGSCIFYDVTAGDMVTPCTNYPNTSNYFSCYLPSGTYGVMSTDPSAYAPAFATGLGWDFATGIGTVNVFNLITNWTSTGGGNASLTVSVTGSGSVTSNPAGVSCPSTCSHIFIGGAQVTLTATPASGWSLSTWGGACSGSGGCTVAMNAAESVTATFVQDVALSVSVTGSGTVTSSPMAINCPSTCNANLAPGTQVTLTATPADGWGFSGWGGACSGVGNCVVTMSAAQSVTATFAQTQYTLDVSVAGNGTVTSSPPGISCPSVCTMNYASGTSVMLTATPTGGASFNGWGGACTGNGSCLVTMNSLESVTAMFSSSGGGGPSSQTFVSATLGSDSNPCTRMSPCMTFAAALALTSAGGEIDVLDPGDFGPVTITKSLSIYGDASGVADTTTSSGTSGIVVSAGSSDVISLHGLVFDGVNASGASGVVFTSGARLNISQCVFQGFTTSGMTLSPGTGSATTTLLVVQDTTIVNDATGLLIQPTGGIAANAELRRLHIDNNSGEGLRVDGTGGSGAILATLADSTASFNAGNGIDAVSGPGNATVDIMRVVADSNGSAGIQSNQSSGGTASVTVGSSVLYGNNVAVQATGGAGLLSYSNNQVTGNATNGGFTGTASLH